MGLFNFLFGNSEKSTNQMVKWLNEADAAYNRALQCKNARGLETYFTRDCLSRLYEIIRLSERPYQGLDRYKHTEWTEELTDNQSSTWIKDVTFDNVRMSHGVTVPVGDDYHERWKIVIDMTCNKISDIRRI